jgi:hypothetical protein
MNTRYKLQSTQPSAGGAAATEYRVTSHHMRVMPMPPTMGGGTAAAARALA